MTSARPRASTSGSGACGLSTAEAGNLTARLEGIHAVPGGWTLRDVERLQFLRWLITSGRFGADDMVAGRVRIGRQRIVGRASTLEAYGRGGSGTTMSRAGASWRSASTGSDAAVTSRSSSPLACSSRAMTIVVAWCSRA